MEPAQDAKAETIEVPAAIEITFEVTGDRRKELVKAISNFTGEPAVYQNAPTFAFIIGGYTVDKKGTLTDPVNDQLLQALAAHNFIAE